MLKYNFEVSVLYLSFSNFQYFYFYSTASRIQILYFYSTTFIWNFSYSAGINFNIMNHFSPILYRGYLKIADLQAQLFSNI